MVEDTTFPAPDRGLNLYKQDLLANENLIWLNMQPKRDDAKIKSTDLIPAVYIRHMKSSVSRFTILYSHGNAEDISEESKYAKILASQTECDILLYEYPGYSLSKFTSESAGQKVKPSQSSIYLAVEAAFRFLVNEAKVSPDSIIVYGRSIGSGPSVHIASKNSVPFVAPGICSKEVAGLFLVSPMLSTLRAVTGPRTAIACCCFDKFPNYSKIKRVTTDVAILHARDDDVVKFWNGEELYNNLKNKTFDPCWLDEGEHNYISTDNIIAYFEKFKVFISDKRRTSISREEIRMKRLNRNAERTDEPKAQTVADDFIFLPTRVAQPRLVDSETQESVEPAEREKRTKQISKEEIRQRRLAAMKKSQNLDSDS